MAPFLQLCRTTVPLTSPPPPPHPQEMPHEVLCTSEELCTPSSFLDVVREVGTEIHAMQLMIKLPAQLIC
jgi:hypothetical protein